MIPVLTAKQVQICEKYTIEQVGIPSLVLMEKAALFVCSRIPEDEPKKIVLYCGYGNNGADGLAAARILAGRGHHVRIIMIGDGEKATEENKRQRNILEKLGIYAETYAVTEPADIHYDYIIDALFGIGLNRPLEGLYAGAVQKINRMRQRDELTRVISIDVPSGLDANSGAARGSVVMADETVTFQWKKTGMLLGQGPRHCGRVYVGDIGIRLKDDTAGYHLLEQKDMKLLPKRDPSGNKGSFGKILSITGSKRMAGAMVLSTRAAFRSGAGMVRVISDQQNRQILLSSVPEAIFTEDLEILMTEKGIVKGVLENKIKEYFEWSTALLIGSGLSLDPAAVYLTEYAAAHYDKTLIVDGDGLTILSKHPDWLARRKEKGYPTILTPHPVEFARLCGCSAEEGKHRDIDYCMVWAKENGCILAAKDCVTLITDGDELYLSDSGTDALATAGSGDVLAGMIAAFSCMAGDHKLLLQTALAVWAHGRAGCLAAEKYNHYSVMAGDLPDVIPEIFHESGL